MTAAQLFAIHPDHHGDLPDLALSPSVRIVADLGDDTCGECGLCPDRSRFGRLDVTAGVMRVEYALVNDGRVWPVDACGPDHGDQQLAHLLYMRHRGWYEVPLIVLRVPQEWALRFGRTEAA